MKIFMKQHDSMRKAAQREVVRTMVLHSPGSTIHVDRTVWPGNVPLVSYTRLT